MASKQFVQSVLRCASGTQARLLATAPRLSFAAAQSQLRFCPQSYRSLHTTPAIFADATPTTPAAQSITTPKAEPPPDQETDPTKHSTFLGEADNDDALNAYRDSHGDPPASLDATNSAYLGEADSDDGFESRKDIDGEKLEPVDATNSAYLGEADSDDGFEAHREAHPEEGDHKIINPEESGLHGQTGEHDR